MFQSIDIVGFASDEWQTAYWLFDTEFNYGFNIPVQDLEENEFKELIKNIVEIYSNKNMNVAYNLVLYIKFRENDPFVSTNNSSAIKDAICGLYPEYADEIEKYMLLI